MACFFCFANLGIITGPIAIPDTGGWQSWTTVTRTGVSLAAGPQTWRIVLSANGPSGAVGNLDFTRGSLGLVLRF